MIIYVTKVKGDTYIVTMKVSYSLQEVRRLFILLYTSVASFTNDGALSVSSTLDTYK